MSDELAEILRGEQRIRVTGSHADSVVCGMPTTNRQRDRPLTPGQTHPGTTLAGGRCYSPRESCAATGGDQHFFCAVPAQVGPLRCGRGRVYARWLRWTGHADLSLAIRLRGASLAMLLRPSAELPRLVTKPRDWRSPTSRVVLLADSPVASARSAIRSSRLDASERCMSIVYSLAVRPTDRTRSLSRWRGKVLTIRMSARHIISSEELSGSTLAMPEP